jgi:uncharacterized SAM-binding protein YcdF (DUF218 family)
MTASATPAAAHRRHLVVIAAMLPVPAASGNRAHTGAQASLPRSRGDDNRRPAGTLRATGPPRRMNDILYALGAESWKPLLTGLVLPPVPLLVIVLLGAATIATRRALGWVLVLAGVAGLWAVSTGAVGEWLMRRLLHPPPALDAPALADLRREAASTRTTIVVLGGGREPMAPEYGTANLARYSMERLRYGIFVARATGLPIGFSGGIGHGGEPGASEAEIAARIAEREFGLRLAWTESQSRDTVENALRTVALLRQAGVRRAVLVTHGFHMPRAAAAFERAAARAEPAIEIVPAPMGMAVFTGPADDGWLPGAAGLELSRLAVREWLGRLAGA